MLTLFNYIYNHFPFKPQSNDRNFSYNNVQHLLWRKSLYRLTTLLYVVASCCMKFARDQKCLYNKCLCVKTFLLFSAMLHVVAYVWPPSQTLLCPRLRGGILISSNHRLSPLFTFNLYLSGFKSSSVKISKQNLRIAIQLPFRIDLQKLKDVLQNDPKC